MNKKSVILSKIMPLLLISIFTVSINAMDDTDVDMDDVNDPFTAFGSHTPLPEPLEIEPDLMNTATTATPRHARPTRFQHLHPFRLDDPAAHTILHLENVPMVESRLSGAISPASSRRNSDISPATNWYGDNIQSCMSVTKKALYGVVLCAFAFSGAATGAYIAISQNK